MCGIFGLIIHRDATYSNVFIDKTVSILANLSESRGKDSSGIVFRNVSSRKFHVFKGALYLNSLLKNKEVRDQMECILSSRGTNLPAGERNTFAVMGHSRLVTNGSQLNDGNNQPVVKDGLIGIHNGIIVNEEELWSRHSTINKTYEIDTEVMLALIRNYVRAGWDVPTAISKTVREIVGTVTAAFFLDDLDMLAMATNNGSLYVLSDEREFLAFASEEFFLKRMAKAMRLDTKGKFWIRQVSAGRGLVVDLDHFKLQEFTFTDKEQRTPENPIPATPYRIEEHFVAGKRSQRELIMDPNKIAALPKAVTEAALLEYNIERINALRRCTRCLLPETFPFISYDEHGVCNYCNNYIIKNKPKPIEVLLGLVEPYRRSGRGYDCIVPYSGGRDSTFTLHVVKKLLKLNPVAFTYDWGMVNDLARRNVARVCGKLGVENIIVSADISWKRENIRRNILAWLEKPHLGMVPLFMAGDKYFFYYTDRVKKQTGLNLNIWGVNPLENTEFKVGFLGVPPDYKKKQIYSLSAKRQLQLFSSVGRIILDNPRYLNRSVWNTLGSFISRSIVPHRDYYHLFDYYRWEESEIEKLVREEYDWETAMDTHTTWRIGDGTAPFYNYIYYTVAGFSEYETFRSNQIREGMLSREEGMKLVMKENRPRYSSIRWYMDIVNIDFAETIKRINSIPKLYS